MKIAVLTSGILPVPAVQGGAVENLVDFYMEYNDIHRLHDITVCHTDSSRIDIGCEPLCIYRHKPFHVQDKKTHSSSHQ